MNIINKKNSRKEVISSNLYHIERQIQFLNEQKKVYEKKLKELDKYDVFTIKNVKEILEYLVSNIEGENYKLKELNVNKKTSSYHIENMILEYTFLYLVKDNNEVQAEHEIKEKYGIYSIEGENYIRNVNDMNKLDLSDNYVKLSFYNKNNEKNVRFNSSEERNLVSIIINDNRFNYINDYINELLNKKLDRSSFKLTEDEIKMVTDNFIKNYNDKKKLVKDIK